MSKLALPIFVALAMTCPAAEPVRDKVNVFDLIKSGAVEYHINPASDFHDDPKAVWTFQPDGTLKISGRGYGYVATKESFRDYHLVLEYPCKRNQT
jgi:hypothetical protein